MTTADDLGIRGIDEIEALDVEGSAIYRGRQRLHNRQVVVKILDPLQDPLVPRRFDIRRKALNRFADLPGVVPLYESGTTADSRQYLVMPYFRIGSLADQIVHGPTPWHRAAELIKRSAEIVGRANDLGVVLGDLKPSSILLADASSPLISVYGMAAHRFDNGGPSYAAPERAQGTALTPAADVYSLALTLAALIAGRAPNRGRPSREFMAEVEALAPARIVEVIDHGLTESPVNRFGSCRMLAAALDTALAGEPQVGPVLDDDRTEAVDWEVLLSQLPVPEPRRAAGDQPAGEALDDLEELLEQPATDHTASAATPEAADEPEPEPEPAHQPEIVIDLTDGDDPGGTIDLTSRSPKRARPPNGTGSDGGSGRRHGSRGRRSSGRGKGAAAVVEAPVAVGYADAASAQVGPDVPRADLAHTRFDHDVFAEPEPEAYAEPVILIESEPVEAAPAPEELEEPATAREPGLAVRYERPAESGVAERATYGGPDRGAAEPVDPRTAFELELAEAAAALVHPHAHPEAEPPAHRAEPEAELRSEPGAQPGSIAPPRPPMARPRYGHLSPATPEPATTEHAGPEAAVAVEAITPAPYADDQLPFRPFDRPLPPPPDNKAQLVLEAVHNAWFNHRRTLGGLLALASFAAIAALVAWLLVRDLRPSTPVRTQAPPASASTTVDTGSVATTAPPATQPGPSAPPSSARRNSRSTADPAPATTGPAAPVASSAPAPTAPPVTSVPASQAAQGLPVPELATAEVTRIRATSARIEVSSPVCVSATFIYGVRGGATNQVVSSTCATAHTLLMGTVTPALTPGTAYTVTVIALDGEGHSSRQTLSFTTLG